MPNLFWVLGVKGYVVVLKTITNLWHSSHWELGSHSLPSELGAALSDSLVTNGMWRTWHHITSGASAFLCLASFTWHNDFLIFTHVLAFINRGSFSLLSSILTYGYIITCLSIHLLMGSCVISKFWLLRIKLLWKFNCKIYIFLG